MKKLVMLAGLVAVSLGFSSCCSMSGLFNTSIAGYRTETKQVKTCGYDTVYEEVFVPGSGKGGMVQTIEKKVPRYKTVTKKVKVPCPTCTRLYCPTGDCCGTTRDKVRKMSTIQGHVGSPNIGLMPTMTKLAP